MGGSRAAQASGWRYKALGMVSAHSLLTLLFMSTGVKDAHGIIGQRGEDGWEDAGRTKQTRERTAGGGKEGEGLLLPWKAHAWADRTRPSPKHCSYLRAALLGLLNFLGHLRAIALV